MYDPVQGRRRNAIHPGFPAAKQRLILLVHGFNVRRTPAEREYDVFRGHLRRVAPALLAHVQTLNWPGDKLFWNAIVAAKGDVASALAEFLEEGVRARVDLVLVGHSLGCRLILEALELLRQRGSREGVGRVRVFLLAAAVPVRAVQTQLAQVVASCRAVECYHSAADTVLRFAFPFGEIPISGRVAEAVGLNGRPSQAWSANNAMLNYGHGDYWRSEQLAYEIALSLGAAASRPVAKRAVADRALLRREPRRRGLGVVGRETDALG